MSLSSKQNQLTEKWRDVQWVLTDVDDTLTWQGQLPPETLIALDKLQQAGIKVVAVTGACAGWCDHIAQLWPLDAVLGENGAFILEKHNGYLTRKTHIDIEQMTATQTRLKQQVLAILKPYPDLQLTLDQPYRLCEVAIDIGQNRPKVAQQTIEAILTQIHALGAHATVSSIHINAWYGEHSKKQTSLKFLSEQGLSHEQILTQCCYVGDSKNDEAMFATLTHSAGVANIAHSWSQLSDKPQVVLTRPGGFGFAQFTEQLLALKNPS